MHISFLNELKSNIIKYNIKNILIVNVDDIDEHDISDLLDYTKKICVVTSQTFLKNLILSRFINDNRVEVFSINSIKNYAYDAIYCNNVYPTIFVISSYISTIKYICCKSLNGSFTTIKNFSKIENNMLVKTDENIKSKYFVNKIDENALNSVQKLKLGFGITTTSSRFKILKESLSLLQKLAEECKNEYDFIVSIYNDELLCKEQQITEWESIKKEFPNMIFNSNLVKSVARAKNLSLKPLTDEKCDQYFILDDDVLIVNRKAIDFYSKACRDFHFLHFHLPGYVKAEETNPEVVGQYLDFKILHYGYDTGCMIVFDNIVIEKCGIWDENFIGWGHEHREFESRVSRILFDSKLSHLSIPEVYDNNYIISFDVRDVNKLNEYKNYEVYLKTFSLMKASCISYDRNSTNIKNIEYIKKIEKKSNESIFNNQILCDFFENIKKKYNLDEKFKNKKKCIIIGANPSIYGYHLKDYINNENAIVLRINRFPKDDLVDNVGDKTDFITTWSNYSFDKDDPIGNEKFIVFEYELKDNNKNIEHIKEIIKSYYGLSNVWTTGFFTILLSMFYFEKVEIFGFGFTNETLEDRNLVSFSYDSHKNKKYLTHDFGKEHEIVDSLIREFPDKIVRLENKFIDSKIPIDIALTIDEKYMKMTLMCINDIILSKQNGTAINFHVFLNKVDKDSLKKLKFFNKLPKISVITYDVSNKTKEVEEIFKIIGKNKCKNGNYITGTAFIRCMLPELLPNLDKVLYLDPDIYVRNDLSEFFDTKFNNNLIVAIKDFYSNNWPNENIKKDTPLPIKNKKYFYDGELLINLKELRNFNLTEKCIKFLKEKFPYHKEMAALNYYLWDKAKFLDVKWCFSYHCIILGNVKYKDIKKYNELYETNYNNLDDLIKKSIIWHFHGNKSDQLLNPALKKMWNESEKRLNDFLKYFN